MIILGIETSCDETSAALVEDGKNVLSCAVYTQIARHRPYGGVVPEIASRAHVEVLPEVIEEARRQAGIPWEKIDAIAATRGPGLASSLLTGYTAAKALALRLGKPMIPVNHLEAHLYAVFLGEDAPDPDTFMPMVCLLVSGGHTCLIEMQDVHTYRLLGQTIDDAAGEALDKGASLLGLGYPGGPIVEKTAQGANSAFVEFPRGVVKSLRLDTVDPKLCFSYSGVKTALKYYLQDHPGFREDGTLPDITASYQEAVLAPLAKRFERAIRQTGAKQAACGGGVACNQVLREKLRRVAHHNGCQLRIAEPKYCTDNAAMVAGLAAHCPHQALDRNNESHDIHPNLPIGLRHHASC
jgi:N6-L-threonylcarbamoyladenine synthase